jgi:hypothetical protein
VVICDYFNQKDLGLQGQNGEVCAYPDDRQGRFGSVLVTFVVTQNLVSIVFCSFNEVKGRFA